MKLALATATAVLEANGNKDTNSALMPTVFKSADDDKKISTSLAPVVKAYDGNNANTKKRKREEAATNTEKAHTIGTNDFTRVVFRDQHGTDMVFRINRNTSLDKALEVYALHNTIPICTLRLMFAGKEVEICRSATDVSLAT